MTKQSDIEMVAKARAWAVKAHAGQKDKAGKDYFKAHVTVVAEGRTRLEVRWIEPTFVLPEGKREVPVATVRRVLGA